MTKRRKEQLAKRKDLEIFFSQIGLEEDDIDEIADIFVVERVSPKFFISTRFELYEKALTKISIPIGIQLKLKYKLGDYTKLQKVKKKYEMSFDFAGVGLIVRILKISRAKHLSIIDRNDSTHVYFNCIDIFECVERKDSLNFEDKICKFETRSEHKHFLREILIVPVSKSK